MDSCVKNPFVLSYVGTGQSDYINTGMTADISGVYSLLLPFMGSMITINVIANAGDKLRFPARDLNEYYEYVGYVVAPDGNRVGITDGIVSYDGLRFQTRWRNNFGQVVSEESGNILELEDMVTPVQKFMAGEGMDVGVAVVIDNNLAMVFNPMNEDHAGRCFGIVRKGGNTGTEVFIQTGGILTSVLYQFATDKPVFVGADGKLSTSVPQGVRLLQSVGMAVDVDTLGIQIEKPIKRLL